MKYKSTRGSISGASFEETLFAGWLDDKSLFMPETIPKLSKDILMSWSGFSYTEICKEVFKLFAGEDFMKAYDLDSIIEAAYRNFPSNVTPIHKLNDKEHVLELFHGPTHSFKDIPLAMAGPLLNEVVKVKKKNCLVYVCTSGDTGSAVIQVMKDLSNTSTLVFFPAGNRITNFQRLQMTTTSSENIHCLCGDFCCDDYDIFLQTFTVELSRKYPELVVTSLNSLSWIRIMMQTVHLMYSFFQVSTNLNPIQLVVPVGGAGHLTSAVIVQKLGFPVKLKAAFNSKNMNTYTFLSGGEWKRDATVQISLSVAMDIQFSSNLERLLYLWTDYNTDSVKSYMDSYTVNGSCKADASLLHVMNESVEPLICSDEEVLSTIRRCYEENNYVVGPHTAVGLTHSYKSNVSTSIPTIFVGCASPVKFAETVKQAGLPVPKEYGQIMEELCKKEERATFLPATQADWKNFCLSYVQEKIMKQTGEMNVE